MDVRIVSGCQNEGPITAATIRPLARSNPLFVVLVNASGDIYTIPSAGGGGGGDGAINDGANSAIKATVLNKTNSNPLSVALTGPSGEQYPNRSSSCNYGRKNVTTAATKILSSNANRLGLAIQNLERQQLAYGFDSSLTVINGAGFLAPAQVSSGDGGFYDNTDYTGEVWGILASGDGDVGFQEFVK